MVGFWFPVFTQPAPVTVNVKSKPGVNGPKEKEIPCKVKDNGNNTFTVDYAPEAPGDYNVGVKFGGKEIPQSPIPVKVIPDVDASKIKVKNLEPSKCRFFLPPQIVTASIFFA